MRQRFLIGLLAVIWFAIAGWQVLEHGQVAERSRKALSRRAHDLSAALSVVIRSQGRMTVLPKARLEEALSELIRSTELESVVLLNESGEITASAGKPMPVDPSSLLVTQESWNEDTASFANLVSLGPGTENAASVVALEPPGPGRQHGFGRGFRGPGMQGQDPGGPPPEIGLPGELSALLKSHAGKGPLAQEQVDSILREFEKWDPEPRRIESIRRLLAGRALDDALIEDIQKLASPPPPPPGPPPGPDPWMREPGRGRRGPPPDRPPWMDREEYDRLIQERGVHWFLVAMPTGAIKFETKQDLRLRVAAMAVALLACIAIALAWRGMERSSALAIELVRTRESADRLRELNITAAGLVHETKNPLNLIRGFAQMISRETGLSQSTRATAVKITEEADRVTGRLNQFLDYARPATPSPKPLLMNDLIQGVFDILACDQEEKAVSFSLSGPHLVVNADEGMLRQVVFNLVLNAVQAVDPGGRVEVCLVKDSATTAALEVRDNGPGVPESEREEIFRPYVTRCKEGTGLGLAVVRRIARAHHWEVACLPAVTGACFRIGGIALAGRTIQENTHDNQQ